MDMAEKIRLEKVEFEEDSNSPIFLKGPGSSLSIGRALCCPGDFTVSERHALLGLNKDGKKTLVEMKVEGPNPVCVLRHKTRPKVEFFEKGQSTFLRVGDQISLSVIKPVFWILKDENTVAEIRTPEQTGNDLESEEAGIAEAIARRKKLSLEREKKSMVQAVNQLKDEDLVDKPKGKEEDFAALDTLKGNIFDPVADLGFLVEGQEFEKYRRVHKLDTRKWHCHIGSQHEVEDSDDETNETAKERSRSKERKAVHGKRTVIEDDEDWQGENEEEKQRLAGIKSSKRRKRVRLRPPNEEKAMYIGKNRNSHEEEEDDDDDDDDEDDDLEGFIVGDEEEEMPLENDKDEEELLDASSSEDDNDEFDTEQEKANGKPFCKYGKECYRKNKEHLAKFQH